MDGKPTNLRADRTSRQLADLCRLVARHSRVDTETAIPGVRAASVASDAMHTSLSGTVLALIVQGAKVLAIGSKMYAYRAGEYLVSSVDLPVTGHFVDARSAEPALGFGLELRPALIAELVLTSDQRSPARSVRRVEPEPLGVGLADHALLDAAIRMLRLLDEPVANRDVLAPMIEREIVWRLLRGPLGPAVRRLGISDNSISHVGRAVRRISAHPEEPFRVEDLARECGLSSSAFHRGFRTVTGESPIQFQKQIRLQKSRLLLVAGGDVTTVGHQVGYGSISQFSREYRRQFGLAPSQDAARIRTESHAKTPGKQVDAGERLALLHGDGVLPTRLLPIEAGEIENTA